MVLIELAEKCEKAEGPDRELDGLIALATGHTTVSLSKHRYWSFNYFNKRDGAMRFDWPERSIPLYDQNTGKSIVLTDDPWPGWVDALAADVPAYTASLDSALSLVPEDIWYEIKHLTSKTSPLRHFAGGCLYSAKVGRQGNWGHDGFRGQSDASPALALCAAALRARAAMQEPK